MFSSIYFLLLAIFVFAMSIGIDLAKPRDGMCPACARADKKDVLLVGGMVGPLLIIVAIFLIAKLLLDNNFSETWAFLLAIPAAIMLFCGFVFAGWKLGVRFQDKIWEPR